jgi:hypothetical protein
MVQRLLQDDKRSHHRHADEDYALGAYQNAVIALWRRETKPDAVSSLASYIAERCARYPDGIVLLQVIEETAIAPSGPARKALARMHSAHAASIRRSALVFTKRGFAGAGVRAVMTAVAMIHPPAFQHELFASVRDAIPWIERDLLVEGGAPHGSSLLAAVETLRAIPKLSARREPVTVSGSRLKL